MNSISNNESTTHTYQLNLSPRTLKRLGEISSSASSSSSTTTTLSATASADIIHPPRYYQRKQKKKRNQQLLQQQQQQQQQQQSPINPSSIKLPDWTRKRSFLNNGFLNDALSQTYEPNHQPGKYQISNNKSKEIQLDSLPLSQQERCLMEDLLYLMIGIEGSVIHLAKNYVLSEDIDRDQETHHHNADAGIAKVIATVSTTTTTTRKMTLETNQPKSPLVEFTIDGHIDESLVHLVHRILPVCSYYIYLSDFVDTRSNFEWGVICHSLCEAINLLIKDYHQLVNNLQNQLQSNTLSLQRMWYYIQPSLRIFETLYSLLFETIKSNLYGSQILNLLFNSITIYGCDKQTKELYLYLIEYCSKPFLKMLEEWIFRGTVGDVYGEFMIEENMELQKENINKDYNDTYWDLRYIIRRDQVPKFLEKVVQKVLLTGKYLNVLKECTQGSIKYENYQPLVYSTNEKEYIEKIDKAYDFASSTLLGQMNEMQLIARLKSLKHYFLLCQGDFISHFMDITDDELKKPVSEISMTKLNSLLQLSLRTSSTLQDDLFKDDLECEFLPTKLSDQLLEIIHIDDRNIIDQQQQLKFNGQQQQQHSTNTNTTNINTTSPTTTSSSGKKELLGIESLAFNYKVKWPLSLVISRKSLVKYQIIFRHLFLCKHVEKLLCNTWNQHQESRRKYSHRPGLTSLLSFSHFLRHRMIHFLQNLEYYMMLEVLEPNWNTMRKAIKQSTTVDEVIKVHDDFLENCLSECMLTDTRLVSLLMKFMSLCIIFSNLITQMVLEENVLNVDIVGRTIEHFESRFHTILRLLLDTLKSFSRSESNRHMVHLITRLDFNNYYSTYFENNPQPSSSSSTPSTTNSQSNKSFGSNNVQQNVMIDQRLPQPTISPELTSTTTTTTITTTTTTRSPKSSRQQPHLTSNPPSIQKAPPPSTNPSPQPTSSSSLSSSYIPKKLETIGKSTTAPTLQDLEQKYLLIKNRQKS